MLPQENKTNKPIRIPRVKGSTVLSQNYQKSHETKDYYKLISLIIHHYTNNGFTYLSYSLPIPELSILLNTKEDTLIKGLIEHQSPIISLLSPANQEEALKGLRYLHAEILTGLLREGHRYRNLVEGLKDHLSYSSGKPNLGVLHPYIKALELGTKQLTVFQTFVSMLTPKNPTTQVNIITPTNQPTTKGQTDSPITISEARTLIEEAAQNMTNNPALLAQIAEENRIEDMPDVKALPGEETGSILVRGKQGLFSEEIILDVDSVEVK